MTRERLLAEVEDVLRTMPPRDRMSQLTDETLAWYGRASAVVGQWNPIQAPLFNLDVATAQGVHHMELSAGGVAAVITYLHKVRNDLLMTTAAPTSVAVSGGSPFNYFEEVRKKVQMARSDLLFVDAYLDAEFVSAYLPQVVDGVTVRLLTADNKQWLPSLLPAVKLFQQQRGLPVEVRTAATKLHDRYLFVDKDSCYQSGASFKDGGKSPTILTQILDAFQPTLTMYEGYWSSGTVRP